MIDDLILICICQYKGNVIHCYLTFFSLLYRFCSDFSNYRDPDGAHGLPVDQNGESPLHYAVKNDQYPHIKALLELEHDFCSDKCKLVSRHLPAISNNGQTPFHLAKSLQAIDYLFEHYSKKLPKNKDKYGNQVFQNLIKQDERFAKWILDHCR